MKRLLTILILSAPAFGQLWSGVLAPARATDWTQAGVVGGIVNRSTICATLGTAGQLPAFVQSVTVGQINTQIQSGACQNKVVKLNPGTYNLSNGFDFGGNSFVTLRGSGPTQTILKPNDTVSCLGTFSFNCINSGNGQGYYGPGPPTNSATWSGAAQGSTVITLSNTTGLVAGMYVALDACNTGLVAPNCTGSQTISANDLEWCDAVGTCAAEGNTSNWRNNRTGQHEFIQVTNVSGNNVTLAHGLRYPNWNTTAVAPGAYWGTSTSMADGDGIEDMTIDYSGSPPGNQPGNSSGSGIGMMFTKNSWIKNVRSLFAPSGGAGRSHVILYNGGHNTIRDSYFYGSYSETSGPMHYGVEMYGTDDTLIENNICQRRTTCFIIDGGVGNVIDYNYTIFDRYCTSCPTESTFMQAGFYTHTIGGGMNLFEGNAGAGFKQDVVHGTSNLQTVFRNYLIGWEPTKTTETYGLVLYPFGRFVNVVGNVLGSTVYPHTIYKQAFSGTCSGAAVVIKLGCADNGAPVSDAYTGTSVMLWGNYDIVNAANRFVSGEVPTGLAKYPAILPANNTLPASLIYSSQPSWWPVGKVWPAIGPDVTGQTVNGTSGTSTWTSQSVGGHVAQIPAMDCYKNILGGTADGSGSPLNFDAVACYSLAPGVPVVSLNPVSLAFGTFPIGVTSPGRLITLTNTGSGTLNITSISASIEYAQTTTCGATLGAGLACTITVTFTPLGVGLRNGAITIVDNASGSPHTIALSGTGIGTGIQFFGNLTITGNALFTTQVNNVPGMSISPGSLAFGSLALGGIATLPITITSTGNSQLVFTSIILADSVNYSQTNNCTVIVPTASCTINLTFSPQSIASLNTSLTIIANDSGSPHVVTITGTGIAAGGDLPLPTFVPTALSLPQAFVDPMAPFSQTVQATVYIGNTTCPTAPLRTNYKGVSVPATVCDFADVNGAGLQSNLNDWCSFSFGGDQRWDVIVTKGTSFDFSASPWLWCDKYNGTPTQKYIVFHSDTPNPRGRQVCSHGVQDLLVPPLPDMGQRNHGCTGLLGLPAVSVPMPVTSAAYTSDSSYNDLANMWTITASGPVIQMGAASTLGDPFNDCGIPSGAGACPTDGVNHIVIQDARIMPAPSLTTTVIVAQVKAAEWTNAGGILIAHFLPAAPHDIGFDEDYFTADADDDGFGNNKITDALQMACATCWFTHNYADGIKRDGSEDHVINTANSPGPVLISHNWMEGGAIAFWGGQAETPLVTGLLNSNTERRRNRMTYNPRWLPSPGGLQSLSKKISGGSCSGGNVLVLNIPNTGAKVITNLVVYLKGVTGVGTITNQWYTAASVTSTAASLTIPCTNGTVSAAGNVFGFATGVNITSAAAMNGKAVKDPTNNNPVSKNRSESKSGVRTLADGEICENSGADGQDGSCYVISSRAYSGSSWGTGGENKEISDWVLTNSIVRNSNNSISIGSRSGSQIIGQFTGVTSIVCAASGNTAAITATGLNGGSGLLDPPNTQTATGTDIYLTDIGNGAGSGTPLLANGFYATAYPTGGSYHNDAVVTVAGTGICPASDTTTAGTVYAPTGGNGVGVNTPGHRYVFQNLLIYNIGDHVAWNGGGSVSIAQVGSGLNNWAVNMTVTQVSPVTIVNAAVTAISVCPASQACPKVVQATVGDLAYVQCLNDPRFSSSLPNAKGARMISVAGNQLSFTYTPQNGSPALTLSDTTTCGLQTPDSSADSGYYGFQSFPWPFYWNHITGVGVNSFWLSPGGQGSYIKTATYANSFQLQPGVADIAPANLLTTGGVHCNNSETYSPTDTGGITFCNDRTGLTFQRYVMSTRSIANFPNFLAGVICGSPPCTQDPVLNPGTNSTPVRVSTPGSSVTCGGVTCDATHFIPDSIGFSGAMVTSNYPLTIPDFRNYSLDSSSPYKAGGILQGMDGKDVGVQMSILLNAQNRTLYVCGLPCGAGPFRDGPRYGFLVWNASTDPSHVNFRIYRNGAVSPTATVTNAYFSDYGLPSGVNSWVVKDWNGTIETSVSGLTSSIY